MLIWIISLFIVGVIVALNISATGIVSESQIHSNDRKRFYTVAIWCLPVIGVIYTMLAIRRDINQNQKRIDDEIVSALKNISENIDNLEAGLKKKQNEKTIH